MEGHDSVSVQSGQVGASSRLKIKPVKAVVEDSRRRHKGRQDPYADDTDLQRIAASGATIVASDERMPV